MPADKSQSFYDVLDVPRDANEAEIALAYRRLLGQLRKETAAPNPRLLAMAKVAHETLLDPERRAEYDASIGIVRKVARGGRGKLLLAVALLAAGAGGAWFFLQQRAAPARSGPAAAAVTPQDLATQVAPLVGRVQLALMSGEIRAIGTAVALGEGEMATLCRGIVPGALLTVKVADHAEAKAEVTRSNPEADVCLVAVKGIATGARLRTGTPPATESLHAIVFDAKGMAATRTVSIVRALDEPQGPRFEVKAAATLPEGTAIFDGQARFVGFIASTPETPVSAVGAARVAAMRPASSQVAGAAAPTARTAAEPSRPAAEATDSARNSPTSTPRASGSGMGRMVGEGFTTLWREDDDLQISEVLDDAKKGYIGLPLAYWTRWEGRDPERPATVGCRISVGDVPLKIYEQATMYPAREGYYYCALAPTMMDLNNMPKGEYTFEIFVNGRPVAESSITVERRIMTPTAWMVVTLLAGFGLLAFLRRNKPVR